MDKITVVIAAHKKYRMPDDPMYLPLQVGAELSEQNLGYRKDNEGENISFLNPSFCELTALYWAWKNLRSEYIGLVHYRRYFCTKRTKDPFSGVLRYDAVKRDLEKYRVFLPKKRKYYIETLYSHYAHTHYAEHLDIAEEIIAEKFPDYLPACKLVYSQTSGYMFNMGIFARHDLDSYCSWLFPILFELQNRLKPAEISAYQGRLYGRVSEILLNVWLEKQLADGTIRKNEIKEYRCRNMEKTNILKKGTLFLTAKFFGRKYKKSF